MVLDAAWKFGQLKGDAGVLRAVEWTVIWTDADFPGTEIVSSGITTEGVEISADSATREQVEAAVTAALGSQLDAIRAHVAETMPVRHRWESLQAIDVPGVATPTASRLKKDSGDTL